MLRGWALAEQGLIEDGISELRKGLTAYRATGAKALVLQWMVLLAELYEKSGQTEDGISVIEEAQILADQNKGERYYIAEMLRLKGLLLVRGKKHKIRETAVYNEAETCFLRAIKIAKQQKAKSLELRAAVSLCRLWQNQGKKAEALRLLSNVYNWVEEGLGTPDLIAAKVLLEELS